MNQPQLSPHDEEQTRLTNTFREISDQLASIGPAYYGDDFVEQLLDEKRREARQRLELLGSEPYFGRLDFQENGHTAPSPLYIGKRGLDHKLTNKPLIIDWRAPIASMFYSFTGGDAPISYDAPDGTIEGEVYLKRNLSIRDKKLERVVDSYVRGGDNINISDEFLLYRLGEKKDNRLRDIVSTIQAEQDRIIRAPRNQALIIQGAAGSGKTTVALHRLAFLLYQYQQQIRADRMIIFAPNAMFLDYISGVLPELGVGDVRQTTFADWALDVLEDSVKLASSATEGNRWFALAKHRPELNEDTPGRFKGSLVYKKWLEQQLRQFEDNFLPNLPFEAWDGCKLSSEMIREWFEVEYHHYPLAKRRERLAGRINRWLEMQLADIGDPKVRKEKSKISKQRLRTFMKKFPEVTALGFYRNLFDSSAADELPKHIVESTLKQLKKGFALPEDLAPLVWSHHTFFGPENRRFDHVVVDEAQDVSPFQIALLHAYMKEPSFTILGDLAQGIHAYRGVHRWEEMSAMFADDQYGYHALQLSYRSTLEIIEFANRIIPHTNTGLPAAEPVFRSGEPVELVPIKDEDEQLAHMRSFIELNSARGMNTIAIIGRTDEECLHLHSLLARDGVVANLIAEDQLQYHGGVTVVPVHLAKGLEFDAVLISDANNSNYGDNVMDAKLLYVACTRALHRLTLLYRGTLTAVV
ncbi:MAG: UvrD-helicase domain-containing protein [Candidatus Cohnella colombiensis]|uniref:UvrD-helicase domain-containing protein n=1 Tax=Candidatus Cohnella colombiensis TaxID=3121368 RepID=A0AA95EWZ0_9BACL|nr:MAG: UvrD-helicase domain-containing protein [Cohnella sp.]